MILGIQKGINNKELVGKRGDADHTTTNAVRARVM